MNAYSYADDLEKFYKTRLGVFVKGRVGKALKEFLKDEPDKARNIALAGHVAPYLDALRSSYPLIHNLNEYMMSDYNAETASSDQEQKVISVPEESIDNVIILHSLEYNSDTQGMLKKIWKVLKPMGTVIVMVPNRISIWSRSDSTPFGHGHPYSPKQLSDLLKETQFTPVKVKMALFMPPARSAAVLKFARQIDIITSLLYPFGGLLIMEAQKQVYGVTPLVVENKDFALKPAVTAV